MKKIVVLTSGGDAPGMNAAIRALVMAGASAGIKVFGAFSGYKGLIEAEYKELKLSDIENIIHTGGTILKSSRCMEFLTDEGFQKAVKNIKKNKFEAVVVLGGDGSMMGAKKLMDVGVNTICIPCTIDNDMAYTDLTIGFDTACNTITSLLNNVRETSASHGRVCVVEVMGRNSGDLALNAGTSAGAELILVPEVKMKEKEMLEKLSFSINSGERCVLVVVAEGVCTAEAIAKIIKDKLKIDAKSMNLGYVQRGGSPTAFDRIYASKLGAKAIELVNASSYGYALGFVGGKIVSLSYEKAVSAKHKFDEKLYKLNDVLSV